MTEPMKWEMQGTEFANCNCIYACPCQFSVLPDKGFCEVASAYRFDKGHFGDVPLDGTHVAVLYHWPGAIHQGNGTMQAIVDERADERQRAALLRIVNGEDTDDMATMWWIFAAMSPRKLPPLVRPIAYDVDVDARRGRVEIPGVASMTGQPIRNLVTGAEHRVRIDFPASFEYAQAEIGSATSTTHGGIALDLRDTYGQFARLHLGSHGRMN